MRTVWRSAGILFSLLMAAMFLFATGPAWGANGVIAGGDLVVAIGVPPDIATTSATMASIPNLYVTESLIMKYSDGQENLQITRYEVFVGSNSVPRIRCAPINRYAA